MSSAHPTPRSRPRRRLAVVAARAATVAAVCVALLAITAGTADPAAPVTYTNGPASSTTAPASPVAPAAPATTTPPTTAAPPVKQATAPAPVPVRRTVSLTPTTLPTAVAAASAVPQSHSDVVDIVATRSTEREAGTGIILTPNGEVLTNHHVIEDAISIAATVGGTGPTYNARVVGYDLADDVAVLQLVGASNLATAALGTSAALSVGTVVTAIGNAANKPGGPTITPGIVVGLGRALTAADPGHAAEQLTGLIAFTGNIVGGDSGGPLLDPAGDVVGMVTAAATDSTGTDFGFAVPMEAAMASVHQIAG